MFVKHPFFSAVVFLSLSATYSNANYNNTSNQYRQYPTADYPSTTTSEISIPQLSPSGFILMHDAKKVLNFVVRSLDGKRTEKPQSTSFSHEAVSEPTAVSDLRRAVRKVEKSNLSEDDWSRIQRLVNNIIKEYGSPSSEKPSTIVETVAEVVESTKEAVEDIINKKSTGQVMATFLAASFIAYEATSLLFF